MRFYAGQRFIGTVAGVRHLFTTVEVFRGGPVEVEGGGARFPTSVLSQMVEAGTAVPDHSCLDRPTTVPAYLIAERCAACQVHESRMVEAPASWLEAIYGQRFGGSLRETA